MLGFELAVVVVLILVNGLLAMSELAIVSSRPARLQALHKRGVRGAETALTLASDPGKFLSAVQIWITLVGVLSGAFSGATLGQRLSQWLVEAGLGQNLSDAVGVGGGAPVTGVGAAACPGPARARAASSGGRPPTCAAAGCGAAGSP